MSRSTLIIGNGLGMALDPEFFKLDTAMAEVWDRQDCLTDIQKQQLKRCVNVIGVDDRPHGEEHLDIMHLAVIACDFLNSIASPDVNWLSSDGSLFPSAIEKYITAVAWHFHHFPGRLPESFVGDLARFLVATKSHIATLNYDNLLYQRLIELEILRGYNGPLVDGFYMRSGFDSENMIRKMGGTFGYYLHLHGSPLFINRGDVPRKQLQGNADESISTPHLVLTHVKHKGSVIANSYVLTTYWDYFERGVRESDRVIMFGYSGSDVHLNDVVTKYTNDKGIVAVEWSGMGSENVRASFWSRKLNKRNVELIQLENILEFNNWKID